MPGDSAPRTATGGFPALGMLLSLGGAEVMEVVHAPDGTATPVRGVTLFDEDDRQPMRGYIVLAVGVSTSSPRAVDALHTANSAEAGAIVFRHSANGRVPPELLAAAAGTRLAVLTRAPHVDWSSLAGLLKAAIAYGTHEGKDEPAPALGDLPALADAIAERAGGAVTIEDTGFRVLAYSRTGVDIDRERRRTILGRGVPQRRIAELRRSGMLRALWATPGVVHRAADQENPERMAIAVRSGQEVLGSIWLAPAGPLSDSAAEVLREWARLAAPHLLWHRERDTAAALQRENALRSLLSGQDSRPASISSLGLEPDQPGVVLIVEPVVGNPGGRRVLRMLELHARAAASGIRMVREKGRLLILLPVAAVNSKAGSTLGQRLASLAGSSVPRGAVLIGVGPAVPALTDAAGSRQEAELIIRVLREGVGEENEGRETGEGVSSRSADPDDVIFRTTLLKVLDASRPVWNSCEGPLHRLVEYDTEHGGDLLESVGVYLEHFGDVQAAARQLDIHANTLRYRLRRVQERFSLDLSDSSTRLLTSMAVQLSRNSS